LHLVSAGLLVIAVTMLGKDESPEDDSLHAIETAIAGIALGLGVWLGGDASTASWQRSAT